MNNSTHIDEAVNIPTERKTELLGMIDDLVRPLTEPGPDLVLTLKQYITNGTLKTPDEVLFFTYMCGSCDGSDKTLKTVFEFNSLGDIDLLAADKMVTEELNEITKRIK